MRVLFFMASRNQMLHFEPLLRLMSEREDRVHLAFDRMLPENDVVSDTLFQECPAISSGQGPSIDRSEPWAAFDLDLRGSINYLFYLEPWFRDAPRLRARMDSGAPAVLKRIAGWRISSTGPGRTALRTVRRLLAAIERAMPIPQGICAFIREHEPDLVLVSPLLGPGSPQPLYVRGARRLGIRTGLLVTSWDNLSNKAPFHETPDFVTVWNEGQRREAADMHGVPASRVLVTGAQSFDHWFAWSPHSTRQQFCERVGLRPGRPYVLYVGSSLAIAGSEEPEFVEDWAARLRGRPERELAGIQVLVRPYPTTIGQWAARDFSRLGGGFAIWPKAPARLGDRRTKADFYDGMYHSSAVVGINTTAMIEGAIVGRPVLTVLTDRFRDGQEGTLHFSHISEESGGIVRIARSFEEHAAQLRDELDEMQEDPSHSEVRQRFLATFVRPHGLERPVAPILLAAIDEGCACPLPRAARPPAWARPLRALLTPMTAAALRRRERTHQTG